MLCRLKQLFAALCLAIFGATLVSCDNLGFKVAGELAAQSFGGVQKIRITPDGKYVLVWDFATGADVNSVSYEVYMSKWSTVPDTVLASAATLDGADGGLTLGARIAVMPDAEAPVTQGALLTSVRGARSYTLDESLQPHVIYAFQVRMVDVDGKRDANQQVLVYSADFNSISFDGVANLAMNPAGKLILSWSTPTDLPAGLKASDVSYDIYMESTPDSLDVVKSGMTVLGSLDSGLALAGAQSHVGMLAEMAEDALPSNNVAPLAQGQSGRFYQLQEVLAPDMTYIFQVLARGPAQESGFSKRVIVFRAEALKFEGLLTENVTVAADGSKISLRWEAATGAANTVSYIICSDANCDHPLQTTTATSYEFLNPEKGQSYTFAVRAMDGDIQDSNRKFVVVSVPDPSDKTPPDFAGLVSATVASDRKIVLKWDASPSSDVATYNIYNSYNLSQPIASTSDVNFIVTGLTPATSYSFVVRAKDASGNEERNNVVRTASTLAYSVPDFAGVSSVERLGGVAGLSQLRVTWQRAGGSVTGYKVYIGTTTGGENFAAPVASVADATATQVTVTGLSIATTYYVVVRAYFLSSGVESFEQNTYEKSNSTLSVNAPTFAGISGASPGAGSLAFTTIKATWPAPQTDGVYDSFVVQYEAGSCQAGFSGSPSEIVVAGDTAREHTITGLLAQTTYRLRVRSRYGVTNTIDMNTSCSEAFTSPAAPTFSGIATLSLPSGSSGFSSLVATWLAASGSFSYYKVEWSTTADFAVIGGSSQVSDINTLTKTITGLPAKSNVYVRVSAVFDDSGIQLSSGAATYLFKSTTPVAPTGEGISSVAVMAADSLKVQWTAPTNAMSALFNGYKLWKYCGNNAPTQLIAKLSGAADNTYAAGQISATFTGLTSNVECCYQVRAFYDDGVNSLASTSNVNYQCKTPTLTPPTFAGVTSVTNTNQSSSFGQLTVNWNAVDASEEGLFSYYEIAWATSPTGQSWTSGTVQVADRTVTSKIISGLTENTTYHFRVRAVNNNGTPSVSTGIDAVASGTTTPKLPNGDNLSLAVSIGPTKARLTYAPPNSEASVGGLFNNVLLFIQSGATGDVATYRTSAESGGVTGAEIQGAVSAGKITLTSVPAVIRVPTSEITSDQNNYYELWGLTPNVQVCVQAVAVYWIDGQPTKYLASSTPTTRCVTPTAGAPIFSGVSSVSGAGDSGDFTRITVGWGAITGECTRVEVSATTAANAPDFTTPKATVACTDSSVTLGSLTPHTDYYIQVRAVNDVGGQVYAAGQGTELVRTTRPPTPSGDSMVSATPTSMPKALDQMALVYTEATSGLWNRTYIWRAVGTTQSEAQSAVLAAAATKPDRSGPTASPYFTKAAGNATATDNAVEVVKFTCYLARAVYYDGTNYLASASDTIKCSRPTYTTPLFGGVASGAVIGTWADGSAKIELTFGANPVGNIEEYWVYYSPSATVASFGDLSAEPWQKIDVGDSTYDADPNDSKILIGGVGRTVAGTGYYVVRYKFYYGPDSDTNTSVSSGVTVSPTQSHLVYVPPSFSGLSYGYYMMQYEASLSTGAFDANDSVSWTESDLATCNYKFHDDLTATDTSCGSRTSTAAVSSVSGAMPSTASWAQAWMACRGSSSSGVLMRLPTEEEWRRAGKWVGSSFSTMWTAYSNGAGSNCNITSGASANTGSASNCKNSLNIYDMAGNLGEWVDSRMVRYNIDDPAGDGTGASFDNDSERRFGYGPTIGRTLKNGIDNISRRYHQVDPTANGQALALGASAFLNGPKIYGTDVQVWTSPSASNGFRCVALSAAQMPTMAQMALPAEPTYSTSDYSGSPSTWTIPENLYAKDVRAESVTINVTGNLADAVAEGNVTVAWKPWSITTCTPTCTSSSANMTYRIYRFIEPTRVSQRFSVPWALAGGTYNPYSSDVPLDPLAVDGSGNPMAGKVVATVTNCDANNVSNCAFTDSESAGTGFSTRKLYDYLVVAQSPSGSSQQAMVQHWRTRVLAGAGFGLAVTFRLEPRFRRAAVFLVDEEYQQATHQQVMSYVPMHLSGLDHDFFMQKYEASASSGSIANNTPAGASDWPPQSNSSSVGLCFENLGQNPTVIPVHCGSGGTTSSTSLVVTSKKGSTPVASMDQGAMWKACRNSGVSDEDLNGYYFMLPTDSEWLKAADWGDLDQDGTIDVNPVSGNVGALVASIEGGTADDYVNGPHVTRCHSDATPNSAMPSNDSYTSNCRSRYGVADMVGNLWEWTSGQMNAATGYDNGIDGLWLNVSFPSSGMTILSLGGGTSAKYDLLRAVPKASGASTVADNGDYYLPNASGLRGAQRGGSYSFGATSQQAGRWNLNVNSAPSYFNAAVGGRCRL